MSKEFSKPVVSLISLITPKYKRHIFISAVVRSLPNFLYIVQHFEPWSRSHKVSSLSHNTPEFCCHFSQPTPILWFTSSSQFPILLISELRYLNWCILAWRLWLCLAMLCEKQWGKINFDMSANFTWADPFVRKYKIFLGKSSAAVRRICGRNIEKKKPTSYWYFLWTTPHILRTIFLESWSSKRTKQRREKLRFETRQISY